jgi:hypothetical protein
VPLTRTDPSGPSSRGGGERVHLLQTLHAFELHLARGLERELPGLGEEAVDEDDTTISPPAAADATRAA